MAKTDARTAAELARLGFERAMSEVIPIGYVALDGRDKSGRTDWALRSTPAPIGFYNLNQGINGVVQKFQKKKEIYVKNMPTPTNQTEAVEHCQAFEESWMSLLKSGVRTLVVDNGGEWWEMARIAEFGKASARAREYGNLNAWMDRLLEEPLKHKCNVIIIHNLRDEYAGDNKTGNLLRWGYKNIRHKAELNVCLEFFEEGGERLKYLGTDTYARVPILPSDIDEDAGGEGQVLTICNSRLDNIKHRRKQFRGKDASFQKLMQFVHPDVEPTYWL